MILGQLSTVMRQSAHRELDESLLEHYGLAGKISRQLQCGSDGRVPDSTRAALAALQAKLESAAGSPSSYNLTLPPPIMQAKLESSADRSSPGYAGPWFGIVHGDLHGGNIMVDSRSCLAEKLPNPTAAAAAAAAAATAAGGGGGGSAALGV